MVELGSQDMEKEGSQCMSVHTLKPVIIGLLWVNINMLGVPGGNNLRNKRGKVEKKPNPFIARGLV